MAISSIMSSGSQGIQSGLNRANRAGGQIAGAGLSGEVGDVAASLIDLKNGELLVKASANVINAGDQMLGSLIDIKA